MTEILNNIKTKKEIVEKRKFAGEEVEIIREETEEDLKKAKLKEKKQTHKALDALYDSINKKKDLNVYDKSKIDWKTYVDEKQIAKELNFNRKDG